MTRTEQFSHETHIPRSILVLPRIALGVIFLYTWYENLTKGLYTAEGFRGFMFYLAEGHPIGPYAAFLTQIIAPISGISGPFQLIAEFLMGLALIIGAFTPLAGIGALVFSMNLFVTYLNPNLGEWIWTYVMLMVLAAITAFGYAGRSFGVDKRLVERFGEPRYPIY